MTQNAVPAITMTPRAAIRVVLIFLCATTLLQFTDDGAARAAEAAPANAQLEEIVVTATRRLEDIQKVPISIVAFSAADLAASGVKGIDQLAALTPGVEFDQNTAYGSGTLTNIAIRGISSLNGSSTTGVYLDDTSLGFHVTPDSVFGNPYPVAFDLTRIEVLRGPQGTLFGAGSEGGTVRFIPNAPSLTDYSGHATAEFDTTDGGSPSYEGGVAFGGPVVSGKLGFRISAWYDMDGGYINRVSPFPGNAVIQKNANYQATSAARIAFVAAPIDWITITPSFNAQQVHKNDTGAFFDYLSDPSEGSYNNGRLLRQPTDDTLYVTALKLEMNFGWSTFTSISSYTYRSADAVTDLTNLTPISFRTTQYNGTPLPSPLTIASVLPISPNDAAPNYFSMRQRVYSGELRLASSEPSARSTWLGGVYYSYANQAESLNLYSQFLADHLSPPAPASEPAFFTAPTNIDSQVAAFGQIDEKLTTALIATAGLRLARLNTKQVTANGGFDGLVGTSSDEAHDTAWTPKVSLSYQIDNDKMVYSSIGKGYREGGVNAPVPPPPYCPPIAVPYGPDSLWSYEVGAKSRLFDGHLQVDSSAYHIVWNNIQTLQPLSCGYSNIFNAGQAKTNGFDVAAQAQFTSNWKLLLLAAYVDSHYSYTVNGLSAVGTTTAPFIQSGDTVGVPPQVPVPWSATIAPEYDFMLGKTRASVRIEDIFHSHNSGPFVTTINSFLPADPSTNMLNIRSNLAWDHYDFGVFINNVLNSHPRVGQYNDGAGIPLIVESTFRPLTVGINGTYKF
jgi:iron complex outermembrane recepter protein